MRKCLVSKRTPPPPLVVNILLPMNINMARWLFNNMSTRGEEDYSNQRENHSKNLSIEQYAFEAP